jgi:ABC-type transport system involved in cytochrome bd biosynthesis fused ATPase/permease subunit
MPSVTAQSPAARYDDTMFAFDKFLTWTIAAACLVLLVRLFLGSRRRQRLDAAAKRLWHGLRRRVTRLVHWRKHRRSAEQAAQEAIRRARDGVERKGNVYTPKSFNKPRKPH